MNTIFWIIVIVWLVRIAANILSFIHLWYVKEYRLDRMRIHLGTPQGKRLYILPFRRPPITPKTIALVSASAISLTFLFLSLPYNLFLRLAITDLLSFPVTMVLILLLKIPTLLYHKVRVLQAVRKLRLHKPMTVIGITGSFGKTSTKEYLATILSSQFNVLKTEASKNSPIGIAETILSNLTSDHQVFIVEMGAYKKREIAEMTQMVRPQIGIITAINPQHQDLFETLENTMRTKYELIQGLVGKHIAIFNADNEDVKEMARWAAKDKRNLWTVGKGQTFRIEHIKGDMKGVTFDIMYEKGKAHVSAPVLGEHQSMNIALAIAASVASGMNLSDAARAATKIKPFEKTMQPTPGVNGSLFINDTFNNNPDAALAALEFLQKTKGKKILVFQPMIELGSYTESSHEAVGRAAAKICDEIILTNNNFFEFIEKGVHSVNPKQSIHVFSPGQAATFIRSKVKKGDTVLFKGKEADHVLVKLQAV